MKTASGAPQSPPAPSGAEASRLGAEVWRAPARVPALGWALAGGILSLALVALGPRSADAQTRQSGSVFLGGQLAVTAEPTPEGADVSLNVLPIVLEVAATPWVGLRLTSTVNFQFSGAASGFAHRGGGVTAPIYLPLEGDTAPYQGFYVGPHAGWTLNPLVDGHDTTVGAELGARWELAPGWTLNLAGQIGGSYLERPVDSRWIMHIGVYPSFGAWF